MKLRNIETGEEFEFLCATARVIFLIDKSGEIVAEIVEPINRNSSFNKRYIVVKR